MPQRVRQAGKGITRRKDRAGAVVAHALPIAVAAAVRASLIAAVAAGVHVLLTAAVAAGAVCVPAAAVVVVGGRRRAWWRRPTPMSGNVMYLPAKRVRPLGITMVQAMSVVKAIGVGSGKALRGVDLTLPRADY